MTDKEEPIVPSPSSGVQVNVVRAVAAVVGLAPGVHTQYGVLLGPLIACGTPCRANSPARPSRPRRVPAVPLSADTAVLVRRAMYRVRILLSPRPAHSPETDTPALDDPTSGPSTAVCSALVRGLSQLDRATHRNSLQRPNPHRHIRELGDDSHAVADSDRIPRILGPAIATASTPVRLGRIAHLGHRLHRPVQSACHGI